MSSLATALTAQILTQKCDDSSQVEVILQALRDAGVHLVTHTLKEAREVGDRYTDAVTAICDCGQELHGRNHPHALELHRQHAEKMRERQLSV